MEPWHKAVQSARKGVRRALVQSRQLKFHHKDPHPLAFSARALCGLRFAISPIELGEVFLVIVA